MSVYIKTCFVTIIRSGNMVPYTFGETSMSVTAAPTNSRRHAKKDCMRSSRTPRRQAIIDTGHAQFKRATRGITLVYDSLVIPCAADTENPCF